MTYSKAVKIAIESMRKERQKYAFDANIARRFGSTQPAHLNALAKVQEIDDAIKTLQENPRLL